MYTLLTLIHTDTVRTALAFTWTFATLAQYSDAVWIPDTKQSRFLIFLVFMGKIHQGYKSDILVFDWSVYSVVFTTLVTGSKRKCWKSENKTMCDYSSILKSKSPKTRHIAIKKLNKIRTISSWGIDRGKGWLKNFFDSFIVGFQTYGLLDFRTEG